MSGFLLARTFTLRHNGVGQRARAPIKNINILYPDVIKITTLFSRIHPKCHHRPEDDNDDATSGHDKIPSRHTVPLVLVRKKIK